MVEDRGTRVARMIWHRRIQHVISYFLSQEALDLLRMHATTRTGRVEEDPHRQKSIHTDRRVSTQTEEETHTQKRRHTDRIGDTHTEEETHRQKRSPHKQKRSHTDRNLPMLLTNRRLCKLISALIAHWFPLHKHAPSNLHLATINARLTLSSLLISTFRRTMAMSNPLTHSIFYCISSRPQYLCDIMPDRLDVFRVLLLYFIYTQLLGNLLNIFGKNAVIKIWK